MERDEKKRNVASQAVVGLRRLLRMSQAEFAVREMKTAVTTVARWETSHPPGGETLLRLAKVAERSANRNIFDSTITDFLTLKNIFRALYVEQAFGKLPFELLTVPRIGSHPEYGYLIGRFEADELARAQSFIDEMKDRRSTENTKEGRKRK